MELTNKIIEFFRTELLLETLITAAFLLSVLAVVFLIGWKVNREDKSIENVLRLVKAKFRQGQIPEKEYNDIKNELSKSMVEIKRYLKIYR